MIHIPTPSPNEGKKEKKKKKRRKKRKATLLAKSTFSTNNNKNSNNTKKMKHNHLSDNTKLETGSKSNLSFKNIIESQATVAKYHVFMKNIEKIKSNTNLSKEEKCKQIAHIEKNNKISLKKYQEASIFGSSTIENAGFNCGLWVKNEIHKRIFCKRSSNDKDNYYVLDVGAINNQYINKPTKKLKVTCIDLNPMGPDVIKYDFFDFFQDYVIHKNVNNELNIHKGGYNCIVLSLVVNFLGSPHKRGDMLFKCSHPNLLTKGGLLFLVLPSACINNSRYFDMEVLTQLMGHINFKLLSSKVTKKLLLAIFELEKPNTNRFNFYFPRFKNIKQGKNRNNFSIILEKKTESINKHTKNFVNF